MLSPHFKPVEHFGYKFDRGMILYEFDALREPEKTRFPKIGEWVKARVDMVEIPTPKMLWNGRLCPDLYIANQLDAVPEGLGDDAMAVPGWGDDATLEEVSVIGHGEAFHDTFIEPMCQKITGLDSSRVLARLHRAAWLPLYWPETLKARASIKTPFWYPKAGFAGVFDTAPQPRQQAQTGQINLAFLVAKPREPLSVCFVVDKSPIYRVTDMDECAGIKTEYHRFVIEYRGTCGVMNEGQRLGLVGDAECCAFGSAHLPLPIAENAHIDFTNNMNAQFWRHIVA